MQCVASVALHYLVLDHDFVTGNYVTPQVTEKVAMQYKYAVAIGPAGSL